MHAFWMNEDRIADQRLQDKDRTNVTIVLVSVEDRGKCK